jgi:hypothetical protein
MCVGYNPGRIIGCGRAHHHHARYGLRVGPIRGAPLGAGGWGMKIACLWALGWGAKTPIARTYEPYQKCTMPRLRLT